MAMLFPRPFGFAVDDLGWNEGSDLSNDTLKGPYRAGVRRTFDIRDYQYMVEAGKAVGARIQCLFILSEMDRENILAKYPTTTYLRENWDNGHRVNDHQREIMKYVVASSAHMEFGLHGTGHEYWAPGEEQKRAEWYNLTDKKPWPEQSLREHIECFKTIMRQYDLTPEAGHSFPESFVPCAYSYYWNPKGEYSLGKLLNEVGVKYANTDFSQIPELNPPSDINGGGFDYGTHVINRINYGNVWHEISSLPKIALEQQETDIIESHWPNWLAQDDILQPVITQQWINYYKSAQRLADRYIAKNTEQLHAQWLYKKFASLKEVTPGVIDIDNTNMPLEAYKNELLGNMLLKVKLGKGEHVSEALLDGDSVAAYFEDEGYGFIYLKPLERKKYKLTYKIGADAMPVHVYNDGTYNVYDTSISAARISIRLRMYGTQIVKIRCAGVKEVKSDNPDLVVRGFGYENGFLSVEVWARDMQGVTGNLLLRYQIR